MKFASKDGVRQYFIDDEGQFMRTETKVIRGTEVANVERMTRQPIKIEFLTSVDQDDEIKSMVRFVWNNMDGAEETHTCPMSDIKSAGCPAFQALADKAAGGAGGFSTPRDLRQFVEDAADDQDAVNIRFTRIAGWRDNSYVADGFSIGENPPLLVSANKVARWEGAGDRDEYLRRFGEVVTQNPAVAFLCGFFVAGSLVRLVGAENFLFGIMGRTSVGKTLSIKTAVSMRGRPDSYFTFDGTEGGIKDLCQRSIDTCFPLDESGQAKMSPEELGQLIYAISQGRERVRLGRSGKGEFSVKTSSAKVHYTMIFTGEESIVSSKAAAGISVRATEVFFNDKDTPVWNSINHASEAEEWDRFLAQNHGWILPEVIRIIDSRREEIVGRYDEVLAVLREVAKSSFEADDATLRKMKTFALALVGAELIDEVLGCAGKNKSISTAAEAFAVEQIQAGASTAVLSDEERYEEFLHGIPARYADRVFQIKDDAAGHGNIRSPLGAVHVGSETVELRIISAEFEKLCANASIDMKRLLDYVDGKGWLKKIKNGVAPNGKPKYLASARIACGPTKVACYTFLLPVSQVEGEE